MLVGVLAACVAECPIREEVRDMNNPVEWNFKDFRDDPIPVPMHWDTHPEWFNAKGRAVRLAGPRYMHSVDDRRWYWGPTEWVRELDGYTVLCYRQDRSSYGSIRDQTDHGEKAFAAWIDGEPLDMVWLTLDELLVDMVRFKYEGQRESSGPRATEYFMRMIGAHEQKG